MFDLLLQVQLLTLLTTQLHIHLPLTYVPIQQQEEFESTRSSLIVNAQRPDMQLSDEADRYAHAEQSLQNSPRGTVRAFLVTYKCAHNM
jgi:hypothetical protein